MRTLCDETTTKFIRTPPTTSKVLTSNSSGTSFPSEKKIQGVSPMDQTLELNVVFPQPWVFKMQGLAIKRTHVKVLGHALGRQPSHKILLNFMKLHLHESFVSMKLLTQKNFEVFF